MLDNAFWTNAKSVIEQWITLENSNLTRIRVDLLSCQLPTRYRTNIGTHGVKVNVMGYRPNDQQQFGRTASIFRELLEWFAEQLRQKGDIRGAARAALLHRHLFPDEQDLSLPEVLHALNHILNTEGYAGVDHLGGLLNTTLGHQENEESSPSK
jgi:hypothetical protein